MPYRFANERKDYSDYASGSVFYGAPGHPAFPVRLVSEVFQRCLAILQKKGNAGPVVLYDPCCGGAYHLSTLAYLHWHDLDTIIGSDIDTEILSIAARNLGLLTQSGLEKRAEEIAALLTQYGKPSHAAASESVQRFRRQLRQSSQTHQVSTHLFVADATRSEELVRGLDKRHIDMVISDIPYGQRSQWRSSSDASSTRGSLWQMLDALLAVLSVNSVVAIVANKAQKCDHQQYCKTGRFQIGKRQVLLLEPAQF